MPYTPDNDPATYADRLSDIKRIYPLESPASTFGHEAVKFLNEHVAVTDYLSGVEPNSDEYGRVTKTKNALSVSVGIALRSARERIASLDDQASVRFESYMGAYASPYFSELHSEVRKKFPGTTWQKWLSLQNDGTRLPEIASDETAMNVLQWHNHTMEQHTGNQELLSAIELVRQEFLEEAHMLHEEGVFALAPKPLDEASVLIGDMFDTAFEGRGGYYYAGSEQVVVQQGVGKTEKDRMDDFLSRNLTYLIHEFSHMYTNRSIDQEGPLQSVWFNEAVTQNMTVIIRQRLSGKKYAPDGIYESERELLSLVLTGLPTTRLEASKLAARAYSGDVEDRQRFLSAVDSAWGVEGVVEKIDNVIANETKQIQRDTKLPEGTAATMARRNVTNTFKRRPDIILDVSSDE